MVKLAITKKTKKKKKRSSDDASTKLKKSAKKKKKLGTKGSSLAKKAKPPKFVVPTSKSATKKLEESESDYYKLKDGLNRLLILPASQESGLEFPWMERKGHYVGGKDALNALGAEKPDDLSVVYGCAAFSHKRPCDFCKLQKKLKVARSKKDRDFARAIYASLECVANIVSLKTPKVVRKFKFGTKIRDALLVAIENGQLFCDPEGLMEVRIRRKSTGSQPWEVEYTASVHMGRGAKTYPMITSSGKLTKMGRIWAKGLHDLTDEAYPIPSSEEAQEAIDLLFGAAEAEEDDEGLEAEHFEIGDDEDPF